MRICRRFLHFDPLTGEIPYWPFPELASVAWRARLILTGQTREEIHDLANHLHDLIAEYFAGARQDEVSRLAAAGLDEFIEVDEHGNILGIHFDRMDELDFPKPENTREFEALEASIDRWPQIFGEGEPVPDLGACLATLALCHVSDAIRRLQYEYDFDRFKYVRRKAKRLTAHDCIVAGQWCPRGSGGRLPRGAEHRNGTSAGALRRTPRRDEAADERRGPERPAHVWRAKKNLFLNHLLACQGNIKWHYKAELEIQLISFLASPGTALAPNPR